MRDKSKQLTVINTGRRKTTANSESASQGGKNVVGRDSFVQGGNISDIEGMSKYFLSKVKEDAAGAMIDFIVGLKIAGSIINKVLKTKSTDRAADDNIMSSARIIQEIDKALENLDDRFLFKIKPDETPFHIGLKGGLTTTDVKSTDYIKGQSGWGIRKNENMEWVGEFEHVVARILGDMYDLVVQNHAVFKKSLSSEEFISGFLSGKGWAIRMKDYENSAGVTEKRSVAEFDDVIVRGVLRVFEFVVSQMLGENDNRTFTGMMEVSHYDKNTGRIWLDTQSGKLYNPFRKDDVIIVQQYNGVTLDECDNYVTKQYELVVEGVGIGSLSEGEDRLDWITFRSFSSPMEGYKEDLITKGDTLVRIDNLSNPNRKGIIQMMTVGEDTPYMDVLYGRKTDPEHALKSRFGNLQGVYNHLFGWLHDFGAYISNLYAVGEFRIAHTGEDVADKITMVEGAFRTNFKQTYFDYSEEDNFLDNASFSGDLSSWEMGESVTEFLVVGGIPIYANRNMLTSNGKYAGIATYNDRLMMLVRNSYIKQANEYIKQPGTHKEYVPMEGNEEEPSFEYEDVLDTTYLYMRFFCDAGGVLEVGFEENGSRVESFPFTDIEIEGGIEQKILDVSGKWDGKGDFVIRTSGSIYIDMLVISDKPIENLKTTTQTWIEQDAGRISLLGRKIAEAGARITDLGIELNAEKERIDLYVLKTDSLESVTTDLGIRLDGAEGNINIHANKINLLEGTTAELGIRLDTAEKNITLSASEITNHKGRLDRVDGRLGIIEADVAQIRIDTDSISQSVVSVKADVSDVQAAADAAKSIADTAEALAKTAQMTGIYGSEEYNQTSNPWQSWTSGTEYKHVGAIWHNPNTGDTKRYIGTDNKDTWEDVSDSEYASATFVFQNKDKWSAIATKFDSDGNPLSTSGFVTTSNYAAMFSEQWNDNESVRAEIGTFVTKNTDGTLESGVRITADVVDINNGYVVIQKDYAKIGGFSIENGQLYWKQYDYFANDSRSLKLGVSDADIEGIVDVTFNAATRGRFGVRVVGSNAGGACIYASHGNFVMPEYGMTYAGFFVGPVAVRDYDYGLVSDRCASRQFRVVQSINEDGTYVYHEGVTWNRTVGSPDLDKIRLIVEGGIITGYYSE